MMIDRMVSSSELDEEDCSYMLRTLELNAFSSVMAAFRAQGMLNKFKEVVLDRLRQALCVSDEEMKMEMKKSAEDECLKRIAETLNPSYDTYSQWALLGYQAQADCLPIPSRRIFESQSSLTAADDLLCLASKHNDSIDDSNDVLASLMQMPALPYVPERLRALLRESETLHKDRIIPRHTFEEHSSHDSAAKVVRPPTKSRRRRSKPESYTVEDNVKKEVNEETESCFKTSTDSLPLDDTDSTKQNTLQSDPTICNVESGEASVLLGLIPNSKEAENMVDLLSKIQRQIQEEEEAKSSSNNDNIARRKRRPKQTQSSSGECARARPFQFSPASNGVKPPRGNPDKRPPKRSPGGSGNLRFSPPIPPSPNTLVPINSFQQQEIEKPSCSNEANDQSLPKEVRLPMSPPVLMNAAISSKPSPNSASSTSLPVAYSPIPKSPTHSAGIKRPRVTSFHEEKAPNLIKISRTNLVSLSPSSSVTKLKLVTGDSTVSLTSSNSLSVSSSRVIFASPTTTINRMGVSQLRSASTPMPLVASVLPPPRGPSRSSLSPTPSTLEGAHGHDYGSNITVIPNSPGQRTIYKRNVLKSGGIRVTANGVYSSHPSSSSYKTVSSNVLIPSNGEAEFLPNCDTPKMERKDTILGRRLIAFSSSSLEKYHGDQTCTMLPSGSSEKRIVRPISERVYTFQGHSSSLRSSPVAPPRQSTPSCSHNSPISISCSPSGYDDIPARMGNQIKTTSVSSPLKNSDDVSDRDNINADKSLYITQERISEEPLIEHPVMDILQQSMMEIS